MFKSENKDLIVFIGMCGSGKNHASQLYIDKGYKNISFADPLRNILWSILGYVPDKNFTYSEFKKSVFTAEKTNKILGFIPSFENISITTGRKMLQNLGSTLKEIFGENFWANLWYNEVLRNNTNIVCTDCRFCNEVNKVLSLEKKGYNVTFIWTCYEKMDFEKALSDTHESEALSQFIYYNRDKYHLHDLSVIDKKLIKKILKDFKAQV